MKPIQSLRSKITVTIMILVGLSTAVSATDTSSTSAVPDELITRQLKTHDPSLAISVKAVLYKLKRNQPLTLVDVRRKQDFERLHIPGSINIPSYAVKTKAYLKSGPVVLVNEGFRYDALVNECQRLAERGFTISILDGGLPAWKRQGGRLAGDLFALDEIKSVSPQDFYRGKNNENMLALDISSHRNAASNRLVPYAIHFPELGSSDRLKPELRKLLKMNKPFQSIIVLNEAGDQYDMAEKALNRMGIDSYHLQGGLAEYQKYLDGLALSWKPRDSRLKTVGNCKPCGEKNDAE